MSVLSFLLYRAGSRGRLCMHHDRRMLLLRICV